MTYHAAMVWAPPLSLATTHGIISAPRGTEMFQFPRLPRPIYVFNRPYPGIPPGGFPHSDISGSKLARSSPKHFAACHVLHRLLAPRHPPHALCSLTYVSRVQHGAGPRERDVGFSSTKSMLPDLRLISRARCGRAPRTKSQRQRGHPLTGDHDGLRRARRSEDGVLWGSSR